jgi:hypothetical protein
LGLSFSRIRDRLPLLATCAVTVALLAFLAPRHLEHWDEIQLELGMRRYDLAWHQPHPPGYVLFVLAGRVIGLITRVAHPGRALTLLAVVGWTALIAHALPPARRFLLALVPLLFVLSPTLLVHGSTGRTYVVESTLWVAILLLARTNARWTPLALGALSGIAGGFRPTVLIWGLCAIAAMVWSRRKSLTARASIELLAALAVTMLLWIGALAILSGGLDRYSELSAPLLRDNVFAKSIFVLGPAFVFTERLPLMVAMTWSALGPFLLVPVALLVVRVRRRSSLEDLDPLLYGALVAFVFYLLLIFDSDGYSLSYVLPVLTWTLLALARIELRPMALAVPLLAVWPFVPGGVIAVFASRARLENVCDTRLSAIDSLPAESTLVVTGVEHLLGWNFRLIMYERPNRAVLQLQPDWFIPHVRPAHPYMAARDHQPRAFGPDGLDLSTLPYFSAAPLRHVVYAVPKEATERLDASCMARATKLTTSRGETLPVLEVGPSLRVFARGGKLFCAGSEQL